MTERDEHSAAMAARPARVLQPLPSLRELLEALEATAPFPTPLVFGPDGQIWFGGPTLHGQARTTYPKLNPALLDIRYGVNRA